MAEFGAISYVVLGVLYAVLCVLLLTSWRGRRVGGVFIIACSVSALWAFTLGAESAGVQVPSFGLFTLDVIRAGAWLSFLVMLLKKIGVGQFPRIVANLAWIGVLLAGGLFWLTEGWFSPFVGLPSVAIPGGLLVALVGLICIEQLYRNTPHEQKWSVKTLAMGLGGLFAYDLFLYSQGMLFGTLDSSAWMARGVVNILFVPLVGISAKRNPDWDLDIFVSRQFIFYSTSLVAVGTYLLFMSLGGYALVIYGGTWGALAQIVFFTGAILVLFALLFSNTVRARARVFLSKHFFRNKYDYREEWLRLISTITGFEDSSTRQIVVKAMAQIVDSPGGLLWSLNENGREFRLIANYEESDSAPNISVDSPLVVFIKSEGWLIDLEEFKRNPGLYGDLELPDWFADRKDMWLIVPLMFRQELLGLVMLTKAPGLPKLNYEDRDLLKTVGNHLAVHLAQENADTLLAEAQQFETYNRLTAFLMHDLNNLIAQQSLIIANAEKHKRNPEFIDDAMQTIANSVRRMTKLMDQLKRGETDRLAKLTELKFIVSTAVDRCSGRNPAPSLDLNGIDASLEVDGEQFTMILTHLIQNAQDATPADGVVSVSARQSSEQVSIVVSDSGEGMTPEYVRDRLFKPFDSTKGSQGMGIGAYQAREFVRKMGGELDVESTVSKGTTITMTLPLGD